MPPETPPSAAASPPSETAARLVRRAREATADALEALADEGRLVAEVSPARLPPPFLALLERTLTAEPSPERAALLEHYHLELLQQRRVEVLGGDGPQAALLHTPIDPAAVPRLSSMVARLFDLLRAHGVPAAPLEAIFGAPDALALLAGHTLAALYDRCYYGGYAAPLYTSEVDLAAYARELGPCPTSSAALEVLDRRLAGAFLHELTHLHESRKALSPPYLDECVAAALGARAAPELVLPTRGDEFALYGAGWFTQVGEHLVRALGLDAVIQAHAGLVDWDELLPPGLGLAFIRLGWEQHRAGHHLAFLGEAQHPEPWIKALWLAVAGALYEALAAPSALAALDAWPWDRVPPPAPRPDADRAFFAAAHAALSARPRRTPEGAWRVEAAPDHTTTDLAARALTPAAWDEALSGPLPRWVYGPLMPES